MLEFVVTEVGSYWWPSPLARADPLYTASSWGCTGSHMIVLQMALFMYACLGHTSWAMLWSIVHAVHSISSAASTGFD